MFLQVMNNEEKEKFLELVYKVANVDGEFAEEEQEIINSYKSELGLSDISDTSSIGELITYFSDKTVQIKKIILFEIIGLVNADDKIKDAEEKVLSEIKEKFELSEDVFYEIIETARKLQKVYDQVYNVIFE